MVDKRKAPASNSKPSKKEKPRDMKKVLVAGILFFLLVVTSFLAYSQWFTPKTGPVYVVFETNKGVIELELNAEKAPITVDNFVQYVKAGFFDGTVFHRVINTPATATNPEFRIVQGGGFTAEGTQKPTRSPIQLETGGGLKNEAYTIAMARTSVPNSATSQFYFNVAAHTFLDASPGNSGYAVFGKVTQGKDVVEAISRVSTGTHPVTGMSDWPVSNVVIQRAYVK